LAPVDLRISVVIATRDRVESLANVVGQVLDQLEHGDELIVVDDSPAPANLHDRFGKQVRVLRSGARGPATARNLGWRATSGEIVAFTDDDVRLDSNWLAAIRGEFAANAGLVGIEGRTVSRPYDRLYEYSVESDRAWNGLTCNVAYRREVLEALSGFDEGFRFAHCEDVDLFTRAKRVGEIDFAENVIVDHEPREIITALFPRRAGWVASERRLFSKHPELRPYPLPPAICAVVVYLRWPIGSWCAEFSVFRNDARLRRTAMLTLLWWWHVAKAVPSLVSTEP
jgi:glycosyltransferase involved in cell wall biosynthesis